MINHFRQAVQGLRPENDIHIIGPFADMGTFLRRHAAADADNQIRPGFLQHPPAAQLMKHLLRRFFPDGAGIEQQDIRLFGVVRQLVAVGAIQ